MVGGSGITIADQFGVNSCVTLLSKFQLFQYDNSGSFGNDKTIPVLFEWTAGLLRFVIPRRDGFHGIEPADGERCDIRLGSTGDDGVCISINDSAESVTDTVAACSGGGYDAGIGPFGAVLNGNLSSSEIGNEHGK